MNKASVERLIWVDLETTGLDPARGSILEFGLIVTDGDLVILESTSAVLGWSGDPAGCDPVVQEMHTKSGLWDQVRKSHTTLDTVGRVAVELIRQTCGEVKAPMAGSTIGFDRKWLDRHLPEVPRACHYRSVDVSSLKGLARIWGYPEAPKGQKLHRAIPDLHDSIAELAFYRGMLFR